MPLRFGPLTRSCLHVCVDMQRMFAEMTEWQTPWMEKVLPTVVRLVEKRPEHTLFTRFIPAEAPGSGSGTWRRYYERWASMTRSRMDADLIDLMPALARFVPPARVFDKLVYSPWMGGALHRTLQSNGINTLLVSGGETEICVLATVLGAIDLGYRVVIATDALCSSADATHEAMIQIYESRFSMQVETTSVDEVMDAWLI